jgi:hypothetical protein
VCSAVIDGVDHAANCQSQRKNSARFARRCGVSDAARRSINAIGVAASAGSLPHFST